VWCQPFPFPVSSFPAVPPTPTVPQQHFGRKITPLEQAPPAHFPSHFPSFPPAHTYKKSSTASSASSKSNKRTAAAANVTDEVNERAKRLQVAKNIQQSITALEEIVEKGTGGTATANSNSNDTVGNTAPVTNGGSNTDSTITNAPHH
jgi:hypothetical protein